MSAVSRPRLPRIPSFTPLPEEESDPRAKDVFQGTALVKKGFHMRRKRAKIYGPHVDISLEIFSIPRSYRGKK